MKLLSEFAARWKRELSSDTVKGGKKLAKEISQNKVLSPESLKRLDHLKARGFQIKHTLIGENRFNTKPGYNSKPYTELDKGIAESRRDRIKQLSEKVKNNPPSQPSSTKGLKLKSNPNTASAKVISSVISPSTLKNSMKKQLLAATAIGGVIGGIALARKVRSDKNKKRGKYRRF